MKKIIKSTILILLLVVSMFIIAQKVDAKTLNMNYTNDTSVVSSKNIKVRPGDEIWLSMTLDDSADKCMAIYGTLEYDTNVLELVPQEGDNEKNNADITLGDNWTIANVSINDKKFIAYSTDTNRSNVVMFIKFKVKDNAKVKTTKVTAKDIVMYDSNYKEKSLDESSISMDMPISKTKKVENIIRTSLIGACVILVLIFIIIYLKILAKQNPKESKKIDEKINKKSNNKEKDDK